MDKPAIIQQINKIIEYVAKMKKLTETLQARLKHTENKKVYYKIKWGDILVQAYQ